MMDYSNGMTGWMNKWAGGELWVWILVGILSVVLLVIAIIRLTRK